MKYLAQKQTITIGALIFVVLIGVSFVVNRHNTKGSSAKAGVVTHSTSTPSEVRPGNNYQWHGGAGDPKKITITKIKAAGFVEQVGVDQNKQVAVPTNIFLVGWFVDTVRPGQNGLSVIDGHVTGRVNDGIFKNLDKLQVGDKYTVELGNGKKLSYQVVSTQSLPAKDSVAVIFSQDPRVKSQLNLVTCSGKYDAKSGQYPDRLVVAAKLI